MLTVSKLARHCGLSRSTVLYYESAGLLRPATRSQGNYRAYGEKELSRLEQICVYRQAGVSVADIRKILDRPESDASTILKRRLIAIDAEVRQLRQHQRAIFKLLRKKNALLRTDMVTKEKWVTIMKSAGFTEADMHRWHQEFERSAPEEHQEFLEFLHIPAEEIGSIREWSRKEK